MQETEFRRYQSATAGHGAMASVSSFLAGVCFTSLVLIVQKGDDFKFQPSPAWFPFDFVIPLKSSELTFIPIIMSFVMFMFTAITYGYVGQNTMAGFSKEEESKMIKCLKRVQYIFYPGLFSMFIALVLIALTVSSLVATVAIISVLVGWIAWLRILSPIMA